MVLALSGIDVSSNGQNLRGDVKSKTPKRSNLTAKSYLATSD